MVPPLRSWAMHAVDTLPGLYRRASDLGDVCKSSQGGNSLVEKVNKGGAYPAQPLDIFAFMV